MSDKQEDSVWPLVKYYFKVTIGSVGAVLFQEVSGLTEEEPIPYRAQKIGQFSTVKMPGIKRYSSVTCKKGSFKNDAVFFDYFKSVSMNTVPRESITIALLDEPEGVAKFTWTLKNACVVKISVIELTNNHNDVSVEEMVLTYEGIEMSS